MDAIHAAIAKHGKVWSLAVNTEMEALYEPLHAARASLFADRVRVEKGIQYGEHARHRLDVYRPVAAGTTGPGLPVVVFFHGGGFTAGDTDITPSMHGNIGNFFASNGCLCFLATYVVLPEARYPSGGRDTTAALAYIHAHAADYGGNPAAITAIGQSAGAAHLANAAFTGLLAAAAVPLHGLALLSPPLAYDLRQPRRRANMLRYHATEDEADVHAKTGVAVFEQADIDYLDKLNLLQTVGQFDSDEIVNGNLDLVAAYRRRLQRLPVFEVLAGHNHISYALGIGLPGDAVSARLLAFVVG